MTVKRAEGELPHLSSGYLNITHFRTWSDWVCNRARGMGNNPSNTNDADNLASPSSPPRAGEASLQQAPWNLQQASASYYYLQPSSETEPSFTVFNPFDRASNRENCPPLSEALHYDSTEAYDSGPSIETLAALYPVDFPLCFPGDERSSAAELANSYHLQFCEQWFRERTAIKLQMVSCLWRLALHTWYMTLLALDRVIRMPAQP